MRVVLQSLAPNRNLLPGQSRGKVSIIGRASDSEIDLNMDELVEAKETKAKQGNAKQCEAMRSNAKQCEARQSKAKQGKASKSKQKQAKASKSKQKQGDARRSVRSLDGHICAQRPPMILRRSGA